MWRSDVPQGWRGRRRRSRSASTREDEQMTVRFALQPPAAADARRRRDETTVATSSSVKARRHRRTARRHAQGYQVVEYPHTTRRHVLVDPAGRGEGARRQREAEPDASAT